METVLAIKGMSCGGCERAIERALRALDGVLEVKASHKEAGVKVQFDPARIGEAQLRRAIAEAGYEAL